MEVERFAVRRREVDLEVTGVQDDSHGRVNRKRNAIDQRVRDADRHDGEGPERKAFAGDHLDQIGVVEQPVFVQFAFDQGQRELRSVDWNVELGQDPGQAANVVFVTVRENDRLDLIAIVGEVRDVGNDDIDAKQLFFREHQAGVDDDNVILPTERHAVHPELAKASQRNHLQFV